ncbi:hypothetical protein NLI96_g12174 [Meripilus lineatus]|uniref:phosphoribosylformylglycinamidine cyclo-ligase n=1 Tax=Meripilus lineatus TaxID=2056292 RepID=A0AAD5UQK7_9APHY|nr:hypothetical protein NLI96_g12174 [Physisporinus lineatus]
MEGSKAFSKAFMDRHSIPTAKFTVFPSSDFEGAKQYVNSCGFKVVLKASGLAAGKGVLIPDSVDEAVQGLKEIMVDNVFGAAGSEVVIEELLEGPEVSVLAFSDGYTISPLPAAQDHKRIGEGDTGLNTGGMGAYGPAPVATPDVMNQIMSQVLQPTITDAVNVNVRQGFGVSVILASQGYPGNYEKGKKITIGDLPPNTVAFHAGTQNSNGDILTSGGRVMAISAYAPTLEEALRAAYAGVDNVSFEGKVFRRDIARRALKLDDKPSHKLTYAAAGVDVDAGNSLVDAIKPFVRATRRPGTDSEIGGFGGVFDLKATGYQDPVLVSGTDGVGTKLRVAMDCNIHDFVGIDLVAMSVNDLLVQGAEPLYFLDYFACSKLDVPIATRVVKSIAQGCQDAGCALIGGETAEMPGMYQEGDYDLAGFAVGAVERHKILPQPNIKPGDVLLGLPSSGLHSNGFSLVRKIISISNLTYTSPTPWSPQTTLGRTLLEPTRLYIKQVLPASQAGLIKAMSHITGGGFIENIPRVLPKGLGCYVDVSAWQLPPVFRWLMSEGGVEPLEMARTFNNGVGLVLVVDKDKVDEVVRVLLSSGSSSGSEVYRIGEVTAKEGVEMRGLDSWAV